MNFQRRKTFIEYIKYKLWILLSSHNLTCSSFNLRANLRKMICWSCAMRGGRDEAEIGEPVVSSVTIFVVHMLPGLKRPAKISRHDQPVFFDSRTAIAQGLVAT